MTDPTNNAIVPVAETPQVEEARKLDKFEALAHEIAIAQQEYGDAQFDYRDPKGNKACRSLIYRLRQLNGSVERARKAAKSVHLDRGREVDRRAELLRSGIAGLIDPHQQQLDQIEREEEERVSRHREKLEYIIEHVKQLNDHRIIPWTPDAVRAQIASLELIDTSDMEEFRSSGENRKSEALETLNAALEQAEAAEAERLQREAERAELERLRAEAAERERRDAEEQAHKEREAEVERLRAEGAEQERRRQQAGQEALNAAPPAPAAFAQPPLSAASQARPLPSYGSPVASGMMRPTGAHVGPAPIASAQPAAPTSLSQAFARDLESRIDRMDRRQVAEAIANGSLHSCIVVDWTALRLAYRAVPPGLTPGRQSI